MHLTRHFPLSSICILLILLCVSLTFGESSSSLEDNEEDNGAADGGMADGDDEPFFRDKRRASSKAKKSANSRPKSVFSPVGTSVFNSRFLDESADVSSQVNSLLPKVGASELKSAIEEATDKVNKRINFIEPHLAKNNAFQKPGTMGWFISASHKSSELAKNFSRSALVAEEASKSLVKRNKLNLDQIVFGLTKMSLKGTTLLRDCPKPTKPLTCYPGRYRSYSGHCNNVEHAEWGAAHMPFARSLAPRYADGISRPRVSISGSALPSPREISLTVHQGSKTEESSFSHMTTLNAFFGEFLSHDIAHAVQSVGFKGQRLRCCGIRQKDLMHPECLPIRLGPADPLMSSFRQDCMEYVRSCPAIRDQCSLGPREQINQASSFIDGSALYGSSKAVSNSLRTFSNGQLKAIRLNRRAKEMLAVEEEDNLDCRLAGDMRCFKSGDDRVNENLGLAIVHTLFLREHNRIARSLASINPQWNDEELFEETRKIVAAEIQHITYKEWLPFVLGEEMLSQADLRLTIDGYYSKYDMTVDPTVDNAVANAVLQYLFTNMPSRMERYSRDLRMMGYIQMSEQFFNPSEMYANKFDEYLLGMISQNAKSSDPFVANEMTNSLSDDSREGFDFVAFTIQRGRDHGLPGYVEYRQACNLEPSVGKFEDLTTVMKSGVIKKLKGLYKDVRSIDLFTGGLSEKPLHGAMVGPTFACLLSRQFDKLRRGDRFWYENDLPPASFTRGQLSEIRKASLSRILCDNGDQVDFVQPLTMVSSDPFLNAFQFCNTAIYGQIDLNQWKISPANSIGNITLSDRLIGNELTRARREANEFFENEENLMDQKGVSTSQMMLYKMTRAKRQAIAINNQSLVLEVATRGILRHLRQGRDREASNEIVGDITNLVLSLPNIELNEYLRKMILTQNQFSDHFLTECDDHQLPCDHTSPFRTITGWCNNLIRPELGKSLTLFERFLPPAYEDGISIPRESSAIRGRKLPSPRLISKTVHDDVSNHHVRYSLATMQWGQFLDHDVTFTPSYLTHNGRLLDCKACDSRVTVHPECRPISIPANDPFFSQAPNRPRPQCLHFVRSMNAQTRLGPREQMNQLTSYVDASNIYGSENCEADRLRLRMMGKINTTRHPIRGMKDLLPRTPSHPECKAPSGFCFHAGDLRASEQPGLACLHTVFLREHNRMAEELAMINTHWTDEKIYQTVRKIIGALVQQITYGEFLPRLLGMDYMDRFELILKSTDYTDDYDPHCSATFRNEISAAVLRLGHTLLQSKFDRLDANYKAAKRPLQLREAFFNSDMLYEPHAIDQLLRGMITQSIQTFDKSITEEVTDHLFEERNKPWSGMDLISLNLQRARDHGLQPYNKYRVLCNLTRARKFEDLSEIPLNAIERLRRVYDHVDDIDLFSGGVSETPLHGGIVGPTFGCLLGLQFKSLRKCDRFWYETSNKFTRFSEAQLTEIRKVMLSKIICTNGDDIGHIQKYALDLPDPFLNPRISCKSLPQIDLTKWKDTGKSCSIKNKVISLGRHKRISPCVNCVCTLEGPICASMRISNCQNLLSLFSRKEILSDQACVVQCAFSLRNNQLESSSRQRIRPMLARV